MWCLISERWEIFLSVNDFQFNSITIRDFNSLKCVHVLFMTQDVAYLSEYSLCAWEEWVFCCCWVECSVDVRWIPFVDVVGFFYTLADFLSGSSISYWKRGVEIVSYNVDLPISLSVMSVLVLCILQLCCLGYTCMWDCYMLLVDSSFYHYIVSHFIRGDVFFPWSLLYLISVGRLCFLLNGVCMIYHFASFYF